MGPSAVDVNPPANPRGADDGASPGISVVILTHNEEPNLRDCLESCAWCDDVHVLDSGSIDRTAEIARQLGAQFHVNPFRSFGQQRNWAIDNLPHKHDWVFHLDADERFTPELVQEMRQIAAANPPMAGYYVPHKLIFMGRWLRHAEGGYPVYQMRFFHRRRMRFRDWGHGQREDTTGEIGMLSKPYIHFNFSKGLEEWIEKHNRYSTLEAREMFHRLNEPRQGFRLFGRPVERRRFFKERLLPRLPGGWFLRFIWMYIVRGGFLDGRPGLYYCLLIASYGLFMRLKTEELASEAAAGRADKSQDPDRWNRIMVPRHGPVV